MSIRIIIINYKSLIMRKKIYTYDQRIMVTIMYKDIKHGIIILNKIKDLAKNFNYFEIEKIFFNKRKIQILMGEKEFPYCSMRSTWYSVVSYETTQTNLRHKTAYSYGREYEEVANA
jgi:hypothetical protein